MRTLKKIAAGLLAAALAVGLLTACSDNKVTGTAKSWSLSNTGKVLGIENGLTPQTLLTYEVNGTEKYIVNGKAEFIGSKEYGVQHASGTIRYLVNSASQIQEADNDRSGTKYQPDEVDIPLWILMREGTGGYWLLAGKNAYNGKMYYTEAFKLSAQNWYNYNRDWLSVYRGQKTVYSYEYVLYYESEDDAMPAFIRINGEGLKDAIVPVKDFQSVEYSQTVPAPYAGLVDRTSYTNGTVTK